MPAFSLTRPRLSRFLLASLDASFFLATGVFTIAIACAAAMSAIMKQKRLLSYPADKKSSSLFARRTAPKVSAEASCPICQEPVGARNPEGITEGWSMLPCGHKFGSYCIKHYLRIVADDRPSCPVCRQIAYHKCGHPVLPLSLALGSSAGSRLAEVSDMLVKDMQGSLCGYCQQARSQSWGRATKRKRPQARWKTAAGWLFTLASHPRRLLMRPDQQQDVPDRPFLPWEADNGPWIDPFPRARDVQWEKWWDQQLPR